MKRFEIMKGPLEGAHLLEASAGTGKTYTIADLYLRLILEKDLTVDRVLVVTFTNAATGELRERLRSRLKGAFQALSGGPIEDAMPRELYEKFQGAEREAALVRLRRAINFFDAAAVYTIHGFCRRMLLENAFESGHLFDTDLVSDQSALLAEVVEDFWRRRFYEARPWIYRYGCDRLVPEALAGIAAVFVENPSLRVVPPPGELDEEALDKRIAGLFALFEEIGLLWKGQKNEINGLIAAMTEKKLLKGTSYKEGDVDRRAAAMEIFLEKGDPAGDFDQLKFYTRSKLMREARVPEDVSHHLFFQMCENFSQLRERLKTDFNDFLINLKHQLINYAAAELAERKRAKNVRSFSDMLVNLHSALHGPGGEALAAALRSSFPAALIDEFQDTDTLQYEIFTRIFNRSGGLLYLIGDPKQAIYRFRGADIYAYMAAARGTGSRATLGRNWRSSPDLVRAVNTVFGRGKNPFVFDENLIGFPEVEPAPREAPAFSCDGLDSAPLQLWYLSASLATAKTGRLAVGQAESLIAGATAGEIARMLALGREGKALIGDKPLAAGDIAV
ncbi:MAG TPA: exodeoxyribonuclease V subunit beta, partial [Spirochaetes bacterium]|nr:exodeoxyribonuclease V subunit beta [Spirochaetota bacterium]